jgi:HSP20 family protein
MIRWSPSTELANLHGAMDRLFEDFFGPSPTRGDGGEREVAPTYRLPLDVKEADGGYEIQASVPGFKPDEVDVTLSDGLLRIQAQHSEETRRGEGGYLRREVAYGNYQRTIQLPGDIKPESVSANFENGILTITVPKVPRAQPTKIQVTSSSPKQLGGKTS